MSQNARIFLAIPCKDRRRIVEQCLPTIADTLHDHSTGNSLHGDCLSLWNDGSTEYDGSDFLGYWGDEVHNAQTPIGIEAQRRQHLLTFWRDKRFTHFYATDSDALHDPSWREVALRLSEETNALVCLYNTQAHVSIPNNTIADNPHSEVIWRQVAPGISYLLTREMVGSFIEHIDKMQHHDWGIPAALGNRCAITRTSYVDHIGQGGLHWKPEHGLEGGDRALNPTPWLVAKRAEIVEALSR